MKITDKRCGFEKEALCSLLGFKGGAIDELWQSMVGLESEKGLRAIGLGVQSVLWADNRVFDPQNPQVGDEIMSRVTQLAIGAIGERDYETPVELFDLLWNEVYSCACDMTGISDLYPSFVLNALVPVDLAAWSLFAKSQAGGCLWDAIPPCFQLALPCRHKKIAIIPVVYYNTEIARLLDESPTPGLIKIKLGADPAGDGDLNKMLAWDKRQLSLVHEAYRNIKTHDSVCGDVLYYLDPNGRYDTKERILALLNYADKIGMLERTVILEEPFAQSDRQRVDDLPVRVAADESVHSIMDARMKIALGYGAFTLKPAAKTLTVSLRVAAEAQQHGVLCLCADLTVNPQLAEWNKWVAAQLPPLPGMKFGAFEMNGSQNYKDWPRLCSYHAMPNRVWTQVHEGGILLDDEFFALAGGVLADTSYYYHALYGSSTK